MTIQTTTNKLINCETSMPLPEDERNIVCFSSSQKVLCDFCTGAVAGVNGISVLCVYCFCIVFLGEWGFVFISTVSIPFLTFLFHFLIYPLLFTFIHSILSHCNKYISPRGSIKD